MVMCVSSYVYVVHICVEIKGLSQLLFLRCLHLFVIAIWFLFLRQGLSGLELVK